MSGLTSVNRHICVSALYELALRTIKFTNWPEWVGRRLLAMSRTMLVSDVDEAMWTSCLEGVIRHSWVRLSGFWGAQGKVHHQYQVSIPAQYQ